MHPPHRERKQITEGRKLWRFQTTGITGTFYNLTFIEHSSINSFMYASHVAAKNGWLFWELIILPLGLNFCVTSSSALVETFSFKLKIWSLYALKFDNLLGKYVYHPKLIYWLICLNNNWRWPRQSLTSNWLNNKLDSWIINKTMFLIG